MLKCHRAERGGCTTQDCEETLMGGIGSMILDLLLKCGNPRSGRKMGGGGGGLSKRKGGGELENREKGRAHARRFCPCTSTLSVK